MRTQIVRQVPNEQIWPIIRANLIDNSFDNPVRPNRVWSCFKVKKILFSDWYNFRFCTVQVTLVFKSIPTAETCKSMLLCRKSSWQKTKLTLFDFVHYMPSSCLLDNFKNLKTIARFLRTWLLCFGKGQYHRICSIIFI